MKFTRPLLLLLSVLLLSSCGTYFGRFGPPQRYYNVRVTNVRGELVADWVAEGPVWKTARGFSFKAVERTSAPPYMTITKYPYGRKMEVAGQNIVVTPAAKPYWLFAMDQY